MEAPPISIDKIESKIEISTKQYLIKISKINDSITFILYKEDDRFYNYLSQYTLDFFHSLSKFFLICENLDDILDLFKLIKDKYINKTEGFDIKFIDSKLVFNIINSIGKRMTFELKLNKYMINKDEIIKDLQNQINIWKIDNTNLLNPENGHQKAIKQFFGKIRHDLYLKEIELFYKKDITINDSLYDKIKLLIQSINSEKEKEYFFEFKSGKNHTQINNIYTKINGDKYNCTLLGNKIIPQNVIISYKIKLVDFTIKYDHEFYIGVGPKDLIYGNDNSDKCWGLVLGKVKVVSIKGKERIII